MASGRRPTPRSARPSLAALERMYPNFDRSDVLAFQVARVREMLAVSTLHYYRALTAIPAHLAPKRLRRQFGADRQWDAERQRDRGPGQFECPGAAIALPGWGARHPPVLEPGMTTPKPLASVSLDLDDLWTYLQTRGDPAVGGASLISPCFCAPGPRPAGAPGPADHGVSGRAPMPSGRQTSRTCGPSRSEDIEIGNHSFSHECWLPTSYARANLRPRSPGRKRRSSRPPGQRPVGFRGPGFSWSPELLELLSTRGYLYDASTLPTFLGPAGPVVLPRAIGPQFRGTDATQCALRCLSGRLPPAPSLPLAAPQRKADYWKSPSRPFPCSKCRST